MKRILLPALVALLLVGLWQWWVIAFDIPPFLVPSPVRIAQTLIADWSLLSVAWSVTLKVTFLSLLCAVVLGVAVAFAFVQSRWIERAFFPYIVLLQVTPLVAIAPLLIVWVDNVLLSLVICATIAAIFPIIANTSLGLRSVNPGLVCLFRMNAATRWQTLWRLRVPSAAPYFFGGLRIASGLSLIGAIVGEFVAGTGGRSSGLAYQILQSQYQLNIPRMFAALTLIAATGVALFVVTGWLANRAIGDWHESTGNFDG